MVSHKTHRKLRRWGAIAWIGITVLGGLYLNQRIVSVSEKQNQMAAASFRPRIVVDSVSNPVLRMAYAEVPDSGIVVESIHPSDWQLTIFYHNAGNEVADHLLSMYGLAAGPNTELRELLESEDCYQFEYEFDELNTSPFTQKQTQPEQVDSLVMRFAFLEPSGNEVFLQLIFLYQNQWDILFDSYYQAKVNVDSLGALVRWTGGRKYAGNIEVSMARRAFRSAFELSDPNLLTRVYSDDEAERVQATIAKCVRPRMKINVPTHGL